MHNLVAYSYCIQLNEYHQEEEGVMQRCRSRLNHLAEGEQHPTDMSWQATRLDRLVTDYMLRSGYSEAAAKLAMTTGIDVYVCC